MTRPGLPFSAIANEVLIIRDELCKFVSDDEAAAVALDVVLEGLRGTVDTYGPGEVLDLVRQMDARDWDLAQAAVKA